MDEIGDCEAGQPGQFSNRRTDKTLSVQRRRELLALAEKASDWIIDHGIQPSELCFFKQAVAMLTDTRS